MSRQFKVSHTSAEGFLDWSVNTIVGEAAYGHFLSTLESEGHPRSGIDTMLTRFTLALMDGRTEFTVLDPDLKGSTAIRITE